MSAAFVTGGSGFVGRELIRALRAQGTRVRALARSEGAAATVSSLGAEAIRADLDDVAAMRAGMRGCDRVFHAAAHTQAWGPASVFERITVQGTANVLAAAAAAGVARLIHVGSEAALLDGSPMVRVDEHRPLPLHPLPLYPASKAASEALALAANGAGLETIVVRPRLIWGAGDTSLLPQLMQAVADRRFRWIGGGRHLTSTCHVLNAVEGLLLASERGCAGEVYFVTDGEPVEFRSFLIRLLATQGVTLEAGSLPRSGAAMIAAVSEAAWRHLPLRGPPPLTRMVVQLFGQEVTVDDGKARRELGYRGHIGIDEGLRLMAATRAGSA